jgi:hypothetical protein
VSTAFRKACDDAIRTSSTLHHGALRHRDQGAGKIAFDARTWPYFDFVLCTDATLDPAFDDHGFGFDIAEPYAVRAYQEHTVEIAVTLNTAMHDIIVAAFDYANMHDLAAKDGGRVLKMIEAAAM